MAENTSSEDQNKALQNKFVSVVGPVCAAGDEANILTLLNSLSNICYQEGLLVTSISCRAALVGNQKHDRAADFTCWLLTELINIRGPPSVRVANTRLQATIMRLMATRNPALFAVVMAEYVQIGLEGKEILFDGGSVSYQCFPSVLKYVDAKPKPKAITFNDDDLLDNILMNIVKVVGQLGSYIHLYCSSVLSNAWLLICTCLEGGNNDLKSASLSALSSFLSTLGLPTQVERQDYLLQLLEGTLMMILSESYECSQVQDESSFDKSQFGEEISPENAFTNVLQSLKTYLSSLLNINQQEMISMIERNLQSPGAVKKMPGKLREAVLECYYGLVDVQDASQLCKESATALHCCLIENLLIPEVARIVLPKLVKADLMDVLPPSSEEKIEGQGPRTQKRKFSEITDTVLLVESLSKWWKVALQKLQIALADWAEKPSLLPHSQVKAAVFIVATAARVVAVLPQSQVYDVIELIRNLCWVVSVVDPPNKQRQVKETWLGLMSIPWLSSEVNLLDLKSSQHVKKLTAMSSRMKWSNGKKIILFLAK
ncbi:hypothetical protein SK128_004451 [Halocaridina rubra]|uniref:Uncharacterized protein n=1 Tax=Halocaridina rubra TaxID=373956 RepID=A0AAN9AH12_HALRR